MESGDPPSHRIGAWLELNTCGNSKALNQEVGAHGNFASAAEDQGAWDKLK